MDMKSFKDPLKEFRPAPFWSWNGSLDHDILEKQIHDMAEKGWGGYFMHSRIGLVTPYLSKEWHKLVKTCARTARKTNTSAWLYDEDKWPSGFAGGLVPEADPSFRMKAIRLATDADFNPETDTVLKEGVLEDGSKFKICQYTAALSDPWFNNTCYTDMLNKEAVDKFLEITVDGYKKEVGEYFGREIPGIFTDEPCYCFHAFADGIPRNLLPWTLKLPETFISLKGYSLMDQIEKLFFELPGFRKVRFDFFDTTLRIFLKTFSKNYFDKCRENNLLLTGHFMAENTLTDQTKWVGAVMPHYEYMSWPGIDKLGRYVGGDFDVAVKQVSSVADQLGKERVFSEVFGCSGQHFDFKGRRWIHNWEAALGVNFVNHHLSLYTMAGERKRDYPPNFFYQQPWWDYEKPLSDYFGRLNYMLTRGRRDVKILILHPIGSTWAEHNHAGPGWTQRDADFRELTNFLLGEKLDFHYGDEIIMENHARVENRKLIIGQCDYQFVIVPNSITWRSKTVSLLRKFQEKGGTILFEGHVPEFIDMDVRLDYANEFPKAIHCANHRELAKELKERIKELISIKDLNTLTDVNDIYLHERTISNHERLIFLSNISDNRITSSEITLPYKGLVERIDLENGRVAPIPVIEDNNRLILRHLFYPGDYLMLKIDSSKSPLSSRPVLLEKPLKSIPLSGWKSKALDKNVLRVDAIDFNLDNKKIFERKPLFMAWDDHFYKAKDGTPFEATYYFNITELPDTHLDAVIEFAENLDKIVLNGKPLKPSGKKWIDINFNMLDITKAVRQGENALTISGKKANNVMGMNSHRRVLEKELPYKTTELEAIYIVGDFKVDNWDNQRFSISRKPGSFDCGLENITLNGYPFYAGKIISQTTVRLKEKSLKAIIEFSRVETPAISVKVNGKKAGTLLWEPYSLDISGMLKKGANIVELVFPTDLFNLMGPNYKPLGFETYTGPFTFRQKHKYSPELILNRKGIGQAILRI